MLSEYGQFAIFRRTFIDLQCYIFEDLNNFFVKYVDKVMFAYFPFLFLAVCNFSLKPNLTQGKRFRSNITDYFDYLQK